MTGLRDEIERVQGVHSLRFDGRFPAQIRNAAMSKTWVRQWTAACSQSLHGRLEDTNSNQQLNSGARPE